MTVSTISVADMHCGACAGRIRAALAKLDGVSATHVNPARRLVLVEHTEATHPGSLLENIENAGFHACLNATDAQSNEQKALLKRLGVAGLAMMQVMMAAIAMYAGAFDGMEPAYRRLFEITSLFFCIPVVTYCATPFFRSAVGSWRTGVNMDVPIAAAISIAFSVSLVSTVRGGAEVYYDSVVMFTFLLLTARYIDERLRQRFAASSNVLSALPAFGLRIDSGQKTPVALDEIRIGDRLWVPSGDQIPTDGALDSERAMVDESILTGESVWVEKRHGARLFAGTINSGPGLAVRAGTRFDRSRICDIAALADRAASSQPAIAQLTDTLARHFVPAILSAAALTWICWHFYQPERALAASLAVLVVSCPCALSLATPAALTAAMTRLRQAGIVLTRSNCLEQIPRLTRALIDKTGTLTMHRPHIDGATLLQPELQTTGDPPDDARATYLDIAAALQQYANHPLARAFPDPQSAIVEAPEVVAGAGVKGVWNGRNVRIGHASFCGVDVQDDQNVYLAIDQRPVMRFAISDTLRDDAKAAVTALAAQGVPATMISGDSEERCASLAAELSIDYIARQDPETKLRVTQHLQRQGEFVLVIGDGVNDVPALAAADISAAVLESNDLVKSKADVLLLGRRLGALVDLVTVGRKAHRIIAQNLIWALGYNLAAIPLAALGHVPPWLAALGMASSSTLVMLNAARLLRVPLFEPAAFESEAGPG